MATTAVTTVSDWLITCCYVASRVLLAHCYAVGKVFWEVAGPKQKSLCDILIPRYGPFVSICKHHEMSYKSSMLCLA